ncbi:nitroreductase family deazaflavin-dependent oxidoreductase [Gordonia sp. zg691]|uniref:Nitroreductase family deazaflavin-dependent oxidoreductase n=1 Tax=Gordonia jinghuaiqii TaxID=2758710 RepID=A0A7D7LVA7_9ACTN|nr:nitroreductase family deazaflavin-dependent oxidoreductase [Gordonia jinghuaiqii]MBD0863753.1 nitroreductase family deazaflavin-dependent oxidoreductase [Gordonia jinghuaiqii]MCR5980027.1 nitroreductase family deazaflavin-dependent oxidoreductase [Gordonia jinghuaiqii]QMT03217.1 nitroreductase family deazaflavin-dependent oxidoreductase [Gordonia jinghuaiqii]
MRLPDALARFNKVVTNPIQRTWAPHLAPFAIVEHVGRKSGKAYRIPVFAWVDGDRLTIILTYGRNTDWVRNVQAAGHFGLIRKNQHYRVTGPRVVPSDSPDLAPGAKIPARLFESALLGTLRKD